jgi:hypothetical protein
MYEKLLTPAATEPVSVIDQSVFSRFDVPEETVGSPAVPNPEYVSIQDLVAGAREMVEDITKTALVNQRWLLTFDSFPGRDPYAFHQLQLSATNNWAPFWWYGHPQQDSIELLRRPVHVGDEDSPADPPVVKYLDVNGDEQVFDAANYIVFADKITLKPGKCWPVTARIQDCVRIEYIAGFGEDGSTAPFRLKQAIKFLAGHWYDNRLPVGAEPTNEVKMTLSSLMQSFLTYRIPR